MRRTGWKRAVVVAIAIAIAWLGSAGVSRWWSGRGPVQRVQASADQLARGRYLADAADCTACHTAAGGAPFAGGVALATPFGTIHGTNITPDPDHGIGRYTADDFFHALTEGEARDGHQLYPAMPYVSYRTIRREDSDAIYAYLMKQAPVAQANVKNRLRFPTNIRAGIHAWNFLFAGGDIAAVSKGNSTAWQRGRYLVETLGHCAECHSPRGFLGQIDREQPLAGNSALGHFAAPDITPRGLAARGWDAPALRQYLSTGISRHAVASDEMLKVVDLSTSRLTSDDLAAMITYLLGDSPPAASRMRVSAIADAPAQRTYFNLCAGCHGRTGEGVPNVVVGLLGNSSVRDPNPHNLIVAILHGLPEHDFPGLNRMQPMPGFAEDLDDAQVAQLSTWLRRQFGGQQDAVETTTVRALRRAEH